MKTFAIAIAATLAFAATTAATSAQARPHRVRVCRTTHFHHHTVKRCHMVRRY